MERYYENEQGDHHAAKSEEKNNAVTERKDKKEVSFKKLEIFFKVGGYEEGFASISKGTLGIFMYIETSYAAPPLFYVNSRHLWLARYHQIDHRDLGSQIAHTPSCKHHMSKSVKYQSNT